MKPRIDGENARRRRRAAIFIVVVSALTGCAHQTTYLSEPPGADVFVDGEKVGETPVTVTETTGHIDSQRVEIHHPSAPEVVRFDVVKDGFATEMIIGGILAGVATLGAAGLMIVPAMASYIGLLAAVSILPFTPTNPAFTAFAIGGFALGFYGSYVAAILIASAAPTVGIATIGEGARKGPDEVFVDFETAEIDSSPTNLIVPLVGAPSGKRNVGSSTHEEIDNVSERDDDDFTDEDESP